MPKKHLCIFVELSYELFELSYEHDNLIQTISPLWLRSSGLNPALRVYCVSVLSHAPHATLPKLSFSRFSPQDVFVLIHENTSDQESRDYNAIQYMQKQDRYAYQSRYTDRVNTHDKSYYL